MEPASGQAAAADGRPGVRIERVVAGGSGLGHLPDGRVVLVEGALPGELVTVAVTRDRPRMAEGPVMSVLEPSPQRVPPPCGELERGCGGCDFQHVHPGAQRDLKVMIVVDALRRIAGRDLPVDPGPALDAEHYRTTLRAGVSGDRAGLRRRRSDQVVAVGSCLVAHPLLEQLLVEGRFPGADEVVLRVGARTGERMAVVSPSAGAVSLPSDVRVVGADELAAGRRCWIHEEVAGHRLRISARSFFQARPDGAEALVDAVARALGPVGSAHLVDLYGGVGLFSSALGAARTTLVERSAAAVSDARVNLATLNANVVRVAVERWRRSRADVVVADPPRQGLRAEGVAAVAATGAERLALVSCDPAALARDVMLLEHSGFEALWVELVDLFPHTHHVEAVTAFERVQRPSARGAT
jgi:23S rRNA (uracil1939-C5)-methyltransferase